MLVAYCVFVSSFYRLTEWRPTKCFYVMFSDTRMGLSHLLLCSGDDSKAVYRQLYVVLKGKGVGASHKTFVFLEWVRVVLCQHFGHPS